MRVAFCGLTTLDLTQYVDHLPAPDEKVQSYQARLDFGGPAANAAFTAAALGVPARLITAIGDGPTGRLVSELIAATGIEVIDVAPADWQAPVSAVSVCGNSRSVISRNAADTGPLALPHGALEGCAALLVDGHHLDLCVAAATRARALAIPVLLDGGSWKPGLERLLPLVDVAVLSSDFRPPVPIDWGTRPVAVSAGPEPICLGSRQIPVPVVDVVDTVGAGDVLHGALLTRIAQHGVGRFARDLTFAAKVASESCCHAGAHDWARHRGAAGS